MPLEVMAVRINLCFIDSFENIPTYIHIYVEADAIWQDLIPYSTAN